jgi:hypothetical protein
MKCNTKGFAMKHESITAASVNLTAIMERDNITCIDRMVYQDGTTSFKVTIAEHNTGYGPTVGAAYQKALAWAEMRVAA